MFNSTKSDYIKLKDQSDGYRSQSISILSIVNQSFAQQDESSNNHHHHHQLLSPNHKYRYSSPQCLSKQKRLLHKTELFDMKNANDDTCTSSFVSSSPFQEQPLNARISCFQKLKGLLIMLVGVVLFDLARFSIKLCYQLNPAITPMEQSVIRLLFMLTFITVFISCTCKIKSIICKVPKRLKCLLVLRSVVGGLYAIFMGCALLQLTYSTAVTLSFTAPLLAPIAAYFVLKERIKACDVIALFISFCGVLIFTNPWIFQSLQDKTKQKSENIAIQQNHLMGFVFIILAATCRAFDISLLKKLNNKQIQDETDITRTNRYGRLLGTNSYIDKDDQYVINIQGIPRLQEQQDEEQQQKLKQGEQLLIRKNIQAINTLTPVFYMTVTGTILSIIGFEEQQIQKGNHFVSGLIDKIDLPVVICLSLSGLFTLLAQYFYSIATKHQSASRLAGVFYFQIITAFLFEAFVFHGIIGIAEVLGTSIILVSSISVAIFKIVNGGNSVQAQCK